MFIFIFKCRFYKYVKRNKQQFKIYNFIVFTIMYIIKKKKVKQFYIIYNFVLKTK